MEADMEIYLKDDNIKILIIKYIEATNQLEIAENAVMKSKLSFLKLININQSLITAMDEIEEYFTSKYSLKFDSCGDSGNQTIMKLCEYYNQLITKTT